MEKKSNAERNWSVSAEKVAFSGSSMELGESVNELCLELDENENEIAVKCNNSIMLTIHGNATSCPVDYSIGSLVAEMKNLRLSQQENEPEHLAGYIKAVIPPSETLVIQHAPGSKILNVGTTIFVRKTNNNDDDVDEVKCYEEIGFVSDIFGSIDEPMYALKLKQRVDVETLRLDSEVFYSNGHSSTRFISVERDVNDHYTVMYS